MEFSTALAFIRRDSLHRFLLMKIWGLASLVREPSHISCVCTQSWPDTTGISQEVLQALQALLGSSVDSLVQTWSGSCFQGSATSMAGAGCVTGAWLEKKLALMRHSKIIAHYFLPLWPQPLWRCEILGLFMNTFSHTLVILALKLGNAQPLWCAIMACGWVTCKCGQGKHYSFIAGDKCYLAW